LSKIGAEPTRCILQRVGVVNLPIFPLVFLGQALPPAGPGISGTSALSTVSAFATRKLGCSAAVTMVEAPFARAPMLDRILQSRSLTSSTRRRLDFR
jgi:hypothetical protein